ncbi:MAG: endonuclease I [Halobacteriovorax sp.]|nr:endonuclease I [Halobacteriovorax sp.]
MEGCRVNKFLIIFAVLFSNSAIAEKNYYRNVEGLTGYQLKSALKTIISRTHKSQSYGALFNAYKETDRDTTYDGDGSIVDMYSENPNGADPYIFNSPKKRCGNYKKEADCYNREHIFPQSSFNKAKPMRSDFFHVYPSDGYVNNRRGHLSFGEVGKVAKWTSRNGSKVGKNTFENVGNTVFEPIDEFKGDIARSLFYFATRYEDRIQSFHHEWLDGSRDQVYKAHFVRMLLKWHKQDPVSEHERNRNNRGYTFQKNRNPFIDHPEWVSKIWKK